MHNLFSVIVCLAGVLNASVMEFPSVHSWAGRCASACLFSQIPDLNKFLIEKQYQYFEKFCLKNKITNWAELSMIGVLFENALRERLGQKEAWVGFNQIESKDANLLNAYYMGVNLSPETKLYCWGDRHGDARSLPAGLCSLQKDGIVDQYWGLASGNIPVLLGDYLNNGPHSIEAALNVMILYIQNPCCVAIRGNHECTDRPITKDWAIREGKAKFTLELDDRAEQEVITFFQLLEKLPVAAFVGYLGTNGEKKHFLIAHAAPDLGVNPKILLYDLKNQPPGKIIYEAIDSNLYNRYANLNPTAQKVIDNYMINNPNFENNNPGFVERYSKVTRKGDPRDLSFCRDQMVNENKEVPFQYFPNITTLAWGFPLIHAIMIDWKIYCLIRSHQHAHALDCKKDYSLLLPMNELFKGKGFSFAWKDNNGDDEQEIEQNDVLTIQVAPDSIYGLSESEITEESQTENSYPAFDYDTIAVVTLNRDGKLTLSRISVKLPSREIKT